MNAKAIEQLKAFIPNLQACASGFGLFAEAYVPLPLTKADIKANIYESIAKVTFSQIYRNPTDSLLETEYRFSLPPNARFDAFQARYEDKIISGMIKEKERAQNEKGISLAYPGRIKEAPNVIKVQVGSIKPSAEVQLTFSYIQKLTVVRNRFYKFVFYSTLGSIYKSAPSTQKTVTLSQYPVIKPKEGYIWNIEVNVKCRSPITYLECTSHKTNKTQDDTYPLESKLTLSDAQAVFDKNFEALLNYETINIPTHRLAKNEFGFCAMIDFLPRYDDESLDDAVKAVTQQSASISNPDDVNMLTATGEYIFLLDRSFYMSGDKIQMAKEALILALKSLPPNSYFNIYSFADSYLALTPNSVLSDEKNVNYAIEQVKRFDADMDSYEGTQSYYPIQKILSQPLKKNHPRTLFLLTGGRDNDPNRVITHIKANSHIARIFSLGIGSSCSAELVRGCASAGRGKSGFVSDPNSLPDKLISLMEAAFTPVCDDFSLEFTEKDAISMIAPAPQSLPYMFRDEKATFYVFLKNEAIKNANENGKFIVTLKNFDTALGGYRTSPIKLNLKEYDTSLDLFKLGIGEAAIILEKKNKKDSVKDSPDVFWAMKESINDELMRMAIDNQVLTKHTTLVAMVKENRADEIGGLTIEKTLMSQVLSINETEKPKQQNSLLNSAPCFKPTPSMSNAFTRAIPSDYDFEIKSCGLLDAECPDTLYRGIEQECVALDICANECGMNYEAEEGYFLKETVPISLSLKQSKADMEEAKTEFIQNPLATKPETSLAAVLHSQKPFGNWEVTTQLLEYLGVTKVDLLAKAPEAVRNSKGDLEQIAITLLLLAWIEKYFQHKKGSWSLIHKKGVQWLKSVGVKYVDAIEEINII